MWKKRIDCPPVLVRFPGRAGVSAAVLGVLPKTSGSNRTRRVRRSARQDAWHGGQDARPPREKRTAPFPAMALWLALCLIAFTPLHAQEQKLPARADLEQKLGAELPLNLAFTDETGKTVRLATYFQQRPVILQLGYNHCWLMCDVVTGALVRSLQDLRLTPGIDFDVVFVSIDPRETWQLSAQKKARFIRSYGRSPAGAGWHFLTGSQANIQALADTVGFHFFYDPPSGQFAHPSGITVITPQGRISKYFYGVEFSPTLLRLALVQAGGETIGSKVQALLLLCYHWNPLAGKYGWLIALLLKIGCLATVGVLAAYIAAQLRREARERRLEPPATP
jgi:protein SCO1/2